MADALHPNPTLLIKLGSAVVHAEEAWESFDSGRLDAVAFDRGAFESVARDPEVLAWREEMTKMAFLPVKR